MESLNNFEVLILLAPILAMGLFHFRKLYFHLQFVKLHDKKLAGESLLDVFSNPFLGLEVFYIFIPIFIKSERRKEGKELELETKVRRSLLGFWVSFVLTILVAILLYKFS